EPRDRGVLETDLAEHLCGILAEAGWMATNGQPRAAPAARNADQADTALGRMVDGLEEADRGEMRIVDQPVEVVHRHGRNVDFLEYLEPLRGGARGEDLGDQRIGLGEVA